MDGILLILSDSAECIEAERVWRAAAARVGWRILALDIGSGEGAGLAEAHQVRSVPCLIASSRIVAVGTPTPARAEALLTQIGEPGRRGQPAD